MSRLIIRYNESKNATTSDCSVMYSKDTRGVYKYDELEYGYH